jgi:ketosteroid isomerase-like protein
MRCSPLIRLAILGVICSAALAACGSSSRGSLPADVTASVEKAVNTGNVNGCADRFTDDAEILQEDAAVVRGKPAIRSFCESQIHPHLSLDLVSALSIVSGDLAFEQGTYRFRNVKIGANVEYGEYLNIWRRIDGQWRIFRSMYDKTRSSETAVAVAEPEPEEE